MFPSAIIFGYPHSIDFPEIFQIDNFCLDFSAQMSAWEVQTYVNCMKKIISDLKSVMKERNTESIQEDI